MGCNTSCKCYSGQHTWDKKDNGKEVYCICCEHYFLANDNEESGDEVIDFNGTTSPKQKNEKNKIRRVR